MKPLALVEKIFSSPWTAFPALVVISVGAMIGMAAGFKATFDLIVLIGAR